MSEMVGGYSEAQPATPEIQRIVDEVSYNLSRDEVSVCKGLSLEACAKVGRRGGDAEPGFQLKKLVLKMGISLITSKHFPSILHWQCNSKTGTNHFPVSALSTARHSTHCLQLMCACTLNRSEIPFYAWRGDPRQGLLAPSCICPSCFLV